MRLEFEGGKLITLHVTTPVVLGVLSFAKMIVIAVL